MADNVTVGNTPGSADYKVASEELSGGEQLQSVELHTELAGVKTKLVPLTDTQLRAAAVPVSVASPTVLTPSSAAVASVGVGSAEAVAVNANRKGLVLCNNSDNVISIAFGVPAVLNSGITLQPQGGSWTMTRDTFTTAQVRAIAGGAASPLGIQEWT